MTHQVNGSRVVWDPAAVRFCELTAKMSGRRSAGSGNVAANAGAGARGTWPAGVTEDSRGSHGQPIARAEYGRAAGIQYAHIANSGVIAVNGVIASNPKIRTRARGDNLPGAQQVTTPWRVGSTGSAGSYSAPAPGRAGCSSTHPADLLVPPGTSVADRSVPFVGYVSARSSW
jgi:hypothetical protein